MDAALLKQRLAHQYFADLFRTFHMPVPRAFASITSSEMQQRMTTRFEQFSQRTQAELMTIHIRTAEVKADECQQKYDAEVKHFERDQRDIHAHAKLTEAMHFIMKTRFKYTEKRLHTLFELKVRFFAKAPTVKTSI